jgi:long-chain acyl-CoA synthetase
MARLETMPAEGNPHSSLREAAGPSFELERGTLVDLFLGAAHRHADAVAMRVRVADERWEERTHAQVEERVRALALSLRSLGLERGARVGILSGTRAEWAESDFGLIMSGLVSVPVYPSLPPEQIAYIFGNAEVRAAFVEDQDQYDKLLAVRGELPHLERVFTYGAVRAGEDLPAEGLDELIERGRSERADPEEYQAHARRTTPDDLATLIYTSGTTGPPKGVMLTHDNLYSNALLAAEVLPLSEADRHLSWLPLSHSFERMAGHYVMWHTGVSISYAESVDTIVRDMGEVRPTIGTGVPYLYDKLYERSQKAAHEGGFLKLTIFRWARTVGESRADRVLSHRSVGPWLRLRYSLADRLVFSKLRARTGGRVRYFISGGGPLSPTVARFMWAAGLPILEGYGLTETSPVLTVNPPGAVRLGTVGPPLPRTELRIADDGEILCRGPQVMEGYYRNEEATREAFAEDGWLRTGDIGSLDEDGYLSITDRKKELLVTAGGKNIAPAPVERAIERSRFVAHAVLTGDRRNFPLVVIQPNFEALEEWGRTRGLAGAAHSGLIESGPVEELIEREARRRLKDFDHHEKPGWILLVPDEFGVATGELTPTLKVKRRVIYRRYAAAIDRAYAEAEARREEGGEGPAVTVADPATDRTG